MPQGGEKFQQSRRYKGCEGEGSKGDEESGVRIS